MTFFSCLQPKIDLLFLLSYVTYLIRDAGDGRCVAKGHRAKDEKDAGCHLDDASEPSEPAMPSTTTTTSTPPCESLGSLRWHHAIPLTGDVPALPGLAEAAEIAEIAELAELAVNRLGG